MSKRVVATVQIMEDGSAVASVRGQSPFSLPALAALDIREHVTREARVVTRRRDIARYLHEKAVASAFEASLEVVRE